MEPPLRTRRQVSPGTTSANRVTSFRKSLESHKSLNVSHSPFRTHKPVFLPVTIPGLSQPWASTDTHLSAGSLGPLSSPAGSPTPRVLNPPTLQIRPPRRAQGKWQLITRNTPPASSCPAAGYFPGLRTPSQGGGRYHYLGPRKANQSTEKAQTPKAPALRGRAEV